MAITFDSVTLYKPAITSQTVSDNSFSVTFSCKCAKADYATYITALKAKFGGTVNRRILTPGGEVSLQGPGTKGTLALSGTNYSNCMITDFRVIPSDRAATYYEYVVTIEQDTAG